MSCSKPIPKFNINDRVIADEDPAIITEIIYPPDSEMYTGEIYYKVEWIDSDDWGTFTGSDLE